MHDTLIILAGGLSSRMKTSEASRKLTKSEIKQANVRDKGIIEVGKKRRPFLDYLLYNAQNAGYTKIIIVTGEEQSLFRKFYGPADSENDFHGLYISYSIQRIPAGREKPLGTADALLRALETYPYLKETEFSVCNSDNLYSEKALKLVLTASSPNAFLDYDTEALHLPAERISRFAVTIVNEAGYLTAILEKPVNADLKKYEDSNGKIRVSMNLFKFSGASIYTYLLNCPVNEIRGEKEIQTAINNMVSDFPETMISIPFAEPVPDLTDKDDIADVGAFLDDLYPVLEWSA